MIRVFSSLIEQVAQLAAPNQKWQYQILSSIYCFMLNRILSFKSNSIGGATVYGQRSCKHNLKVIMLNHPDAQGKIKNRK